ncbi:MAG: hypothetical protein IJT27_01105 [Clostridia bacterium]|nr:hypothetical protein [Clostridia bacterium]
MSPQKTASPLVKHGLNATRLKLIAAAAMLCDHASVVFYGEDMTILRWIGRLAFPIFCYFIAVGAEKTKNTARYFARLLAFAVVSEVPYDLVLSGRVWDTSRQNVMFTLLLGLFTVRCARFAEKKKGAAVLTACVGILAACALAYYLRPDYGIGGVLCILCFHFALISKDKGMFFLFVLLAVFLPAVHFELLFRYAGKLFLKYPVNKNELAAFAAVPLLLLHNGKKGTVRLKYAFYVFYPAHLLLLRLIYLIAGKF